MKLTKSLVKKGGKKSLKKTLKMKKSKKGGKKGSKKSLNIKKARKTRKMKGGGMFDSITTAYNCALPDENEEVVKRRKEFLERDAEKETPEGEAKPEIKEEENMIHHHEANNFGTKDYYRKAGIPGRGETMLCYKHRDQDKAKKYDKSSGY